LDERTPREDFEGEYTGLTFIKDYRNCIQTTNDPTIHFFDKFTPIPTILSNMMELNLDPKLLILSLMALNKTIGVDPEKVVQVDCKMFITFQLLAVLLARSTVDSG